MYIVEWNDHEGNQHQRVFGSREVAELEAASLEREFDYVAILWEEEV